MAKSQYAAMPLAELEVLAAEKSAAVDAVKALSVEDVTDEQLASAEVAASDAKEIGVAIEAKRAERAKHERIAALAAVELPKQTGCEIPGVTAGKTLVPASVRKRHNLQAFKGPDANEEAWKAGVFWAAAMGHKDSIRRANDMPEIRAALSGSTNNAGGFTVPDIVESSIVYLREQYGVFRRNARRVPMSSDTLLVPRLTASTTVYHVAQGAQITAADPTFAQATVSAIKLAALTLVASELTEDSLIDIADMLARDFAYKFALQEDTDGFLGDGTGTYGSITGLASAVGAAATYTCATGINTIPELTLATLHGTMAKMLIVPGIRPKWYMHSEVYHQGCAPLMSAAGGNTVQNIEQGMSASPMLLGYPVEFVQVMPGGSAGNNALVAWFGDLSMAATFGDRRGISVQASSEFKFDYDQVAIRATERFGITVHDAGDGSNKGPIALLKLASA